VELHDYLAILRKRWLSILLVTLVAAGAGLGLSLAATPQYTASTQLYVSVQGGATSSDLLQGANYSRQQVTSYTQMVKSPLVLQPVVDELDLDVSARELAGRVSASSPLNTSLITIQVTDVDPATAARVADTVAAEFSAVISELETPADGGASTVKVSTVRPAAEPQAPSSPNTKLNVALGLVAGLVVGIGVAILRSVLDTRVRTAQDVAQVTDAAVIATVGYDDDADAHPLIVHSSPQSERAEALRRLRTNLQFLDLADRPRSIVCTSSVPGEGKSTTAINLAITLADAGARVALVDADLRRPSVAQYMGLEGSAGLTTVLIGKAGLADVVQPWGEADLHVLTSGVVPPNPSELLGSSAMSRLLDQLSAEYDHVVIDAPPLLPVTDAAILAKISGGAIVIAGAQKIHRDQLRESMGALETVGARVLGVVLNGQKRAQGDAYAYYNYRADEAAPAAPKDQDPSGPVEVRRTA